jgi:hypothetical protein
VAELRTYVAEFRTYVAEFRIGAGNVEGGDINHATTL